MVNDSLYRGTVREIILRATAQQAWDLIAQLPVRLETVIAAGHITTEEMAEYFKEELDKLV